MNIKHCFQFCSRIAVCGLFLVTLLPVTIQAQTASWTKQVGISGDDTSSGVATDNKGNVYITGYTYGSSGGERGDAWVAKYNSASTLIWKKQLGTESNDTSNDIATDNKGNVYISGRTYGSLGGEQQGSGDAWLAKYNTAGTLIWKKQLGTTGYDESTSVATDSKGNVYISGRTAGSSKGANQGSSGVWAAKYSSVGALIWKKQLGTTGYDESKDVATDSKDNVYIVYGYTTEWVAKYNSVGALVWKKQLDITGSDELTGVATDSKGNVYISGWRANNPYGEAYEEEDGAWVAKYNSAGALLWKKQLGTSMDDKSSGVATDSNGNVYISGSTYGSLGGASYGLLDAWVVKYNSTGTLVWKRQLGDGNFNTSSGVATDSNGNVYISGETVPYSPDPPTFLVTTDGNGNVYLTDSNGNVSISGKTLPYSPDSRFRVTSDAWVAKYNSADVLL